MQRLLSRNVPFDSSGQALSERTQSRSGIGAIYSHFSQRQRQVGRTAPRPTESMDEMEVLWVRELHGSRAQPSAC